MIVDEDCAMQRRVVVESPYRKGLQFPPELDPPQELLLFDEGTVLNEAECF